MDRNNAIITVKFVKKGTMLDLEVPLDISANELCTALYEKYLPELHENASSHSLKAERPIALLRGEKTLREYGIRDASVINITE